MGASNDDNGVGRLEGGGGRVGGGGDGRAVGGGVRAVEGVVSFSEATPERLIKLLLPDIWVKGNDYQVNDLSEAKVIQEYGGQIKLVDLVRGCSTSAIISKIQEQERESS